MALSTTTKQGFHVLVATMALAALIMTVAAGPTTVLAAAANEEAATDSPSMKPDSHVFITNDKDEIKLEEEMINCGVCVHGIKTMWYQGEEVRKHCHDNPGDIDDKCNLSLLNRDAIREVVRNGCAHLPKTHKAMRLSENEFQMIEDANPGHTQEIADHIQAVCEKWVHSEHDAEMVAHYLYMNLNNRKSADDILYVLQKRFCKSVCNYPAKEKRKPRPHYYDNRENQRDFSEAIEMEKQKISADEVERSRQAEEDRLAAEAIRFGEAQGDDVSEHHRVDEDEVHRLAEEQLKNYYDPEDTGYYSGDL